MNEKSKERMIKQQTAIYQGLVNEFGMPVVEDELSSDELPSTFNHFFIVYGDFQKTDSATVLLQEIYIVYLSEDNPEVETFTLDVISTISKVNGVEFNRTVKERLKKKDSDDYIDQVTLIFNRKVKYDC
ncbi:hypothetical protein [Evansella clarkii]|uniref:hypothetical protein n=1 Tax=Evansella clarkii TaxID=79879 RepID=UPI000B443F54|nr:hypothetical protein [Evansella clarkii]